MPINALRKIVTDIRKLYVW